jgi:hypothetical protein
MVPQGYTPLALIIAEPHQYLTYYSTYLSSVVHVTQRVYVYAMEPEGRLRDPGSN